MTRRRRSTGVVAVACTVAGLVSGCSDDPVGPPQAGPGVTFTYPYDGQQDVPVGTRITVGFTDPIELSALEETCSQGENGISGGFCVVGPDGPLLTSPTVAGPDGTVLHLSSDQLMPGTEYQIFASPRLIAAAADNLSDDEPLLSFRTRQPAQRGAEPPMILSINNDDPAAFSPDGTPALPFVDFSTIRVLFSEPIDHHTVIPDATFQFVDDADQAIDGTLLIQGIHMTFDPTDDLEPDRTYELRFLAGITDMGGEPLAAQSFSFTPQSSLTEGKLIELVLNTHPADGDAEFPADTSIAGVSPNVIGMSTPLVGDITLLSQDGNVAGQMGNPQKFGGPIPITIRKGQLLTHSGIDVSLGGVVPTDLSTGDVQVRFVSDASGYITRNPNRDPALYPDDANAPVYVFLTFDVAVSAQDAIGNAVLNQTIMGVQATGVAVVDGKSLAIETVGTMELGLLGVATAPANLVLRLRTELGADVPTDRDAPTLVATYPQHGDDDVSVSESIALTFSEPIELHATDAGAPVTLTRASDGMAIPIALTASGATAIVTPRVPLDPDADHVLELRDGVRDLAGTPLEIEPDDATSGNGFVIFRTQAISPDTPAPPLLTMLYPGVPCALTNDGDWDQPGSCVDGLPDDEPYQPFELPANQVVEGFFNQPIQASSLELGTACGTGSVRIEAYDGADCTPVAGSLIKRARGFQFVPNQPWTPGQRYKLTLVAGQDATCDPGEICGANGRPLNTNPLLGTIGSDPDSDGGPDLIIPFTATGVTPDTYMAAASLPFTDINGNGVTDTGETPRLENSAVNSIVEVGGDFASASFDQDCDPVAAGSQGCMYVNAQLPVSIGAAQDNCAIGGETVPRCIPAQVFPQIIYATSLTILLQPDGGGFPIPAQTGPLSLRVRSSPQNPALGYVVEDNGAPRFRAELAMYMDAPDMVLIGSLDHDLHSKSLVLESRGPVAFTPDGRIQIEMANTAPVSVTVNVVDAGGDVGYVRMEIPVGSMNLRLVSPDRHAALIRAQF